MKHPLTKVSRPKEMTNKDVPCDRFNKNKNRHMKHPLTKASRSKEMTNKDVPCDRFNKNKYRHIKSIVISVIALLFNVFAFSQPSCFVYPEGSNERKACELSLKAIEYAQGSKESQLLFDKAISIAPKFAWAYYQKSVPFLKRGFLYEGLEILNTAVVIDPLSYLPYRAYWYWQYKNYDLCIRDLEEYYALPKSYMQFTPGGEKDMKLILGLAYSKTGDYVKGIQVIESYFDDHRSKDDVGLSDYHTLGVLYFYNKQYDKSIAAFQKQIDFIAMADTYYFWGLAYKEKLNFEAAKIKFKKGLTLFKTPNRFVNLNAGFPVFESDIRNETSMYKGFYTQGDD